MLMDSYAYKCAEAVRKSKVLIKVAVDRVKRFI